MKGWKIWIDTGGAFTDCMAVDPEGKVSRMKVLSNGSLGGKINKCIAPDAYEIDQNWGVDDDLFIHYDFCLLEKPSEIVKVLSFDSQKSILTLSGGRSEDIVGREFEIFADEEAAVLAARIVTKTTLKRELPDMEMYRFSTKGTAGVEDKGIRPLLITTKGFSDLSLNGTQQQNQLFTLSIEKANPLFDKVIEVDESIDVQGSVLTELSESKINNLLREVFEFRPGIVIIAFMNSYKNPAHEKTIFNVLNTAGIKYLYASYMLK